MKKMKKKNEEKGEKKEEKKKEKMKKQCYAHKKQEKKTCTVNPYIPDFF